MNPRPMALKAYSEYTKMCEAAGQAPDPTETRA